MIDYTRMWPTAALMVSFWLVQCGGETVADDSSGSGDAGDVESVDCVQCATASCDVQLRICYGETWPTGDFSQGLCGDLYTCVVTCGAETGCLRGCEGQLTPQCRTCSDGAAACLTDHCQMCFQ